MNLVFDSTLIIHYPDRLDDVAILYYTKYGQYHEEGPIGCHKITSLTLIIISITTNISIHLGVSQGFQLPSNKIDSC